MEKDKKIVKAFQKEILDWYSKNRRDLPWRLTRDPYKILVSEVMLQQTQVSRVIPKYEAWFVAFPTVDDVAKAKTSEVLRLWSGLGYNRRALFLQKAAQAVVGQYNGMFPQTVEELKQLPGIGEYTARAVACFAFNQQIAVVDTNIRKVILTKFGKCHCEELKRRSNLDHKKDCRASLAMTNKEIQTIADQLLPKGRALRLRSGRLLKASAYDWNQALMDYSAVVLSQHKIPIPKQSKFIGSKRYYRGTIIKLLLQKQQIEEEHLRDRLQKEFQLQNPEWFGQILRDLEKEGFIQKNQTIISLA